MRHEKTLKRPNGSRVKITVHLSVEFTTFYWTSIIEICEAGKRKFIQSQDAANVEEIREVKKELINQITF